MGWWGDLEIFTSVGVCPPLQPKPTATALWSNLQKADTTCCFASKTKPVEKRQETRTPQRYFPYFLLPKDRLRALHECTDQRTPLYISHRSLLPLPYVCIFLFYACSSCWLVKKEFKYGRIPIGENKKEGVLLDVC